MILKLSNIIIFLSFYLLLRQGTPLCNVYPLIHVFYKVFKHRIIGVYIAIFTFSKKLFMNFYNFVQNLTGPCSTVGSESDCRSRGHVAQSVASLTADPEAVSLIQAQSYIFIEVDHEIISTIILPLPLIQEGLLSVTSKSMCMKYWLSA